MPRRIVDQSLVVTKALPNGAATVYSDPIDLKTTSRGDFLAGVDFHLEAPALVVGDLADGATMKYSAQWASDAAFTSPVTIYPDVIVQTGAGGAGAVAADMRFALPSTVYGYVRIRAINSGVGDASDKSLTLTPKF